MKFTDREIERIRRVLAEFPGSTLVISYATAEQIRQLKDAGLSGVCRKQRRADEAEDQG